MINLEPGEEIKFKIKKHWWKIFTWAFYLVGLAIIPLFIAGILIAISNKIIDEKTISIFGFFYCMWLGILWILFFVEWTDFRLDMWIVTNHRIVDVDQAGLFARDIAMVELQDVEDITIEMHGPIRTFLKFGTIMIQTAGSTNEFYINDIANPEEYREAIYSLVHRIKKHDHGNNP